jgi:hypothetical protein
MQADSTYMPERLDHLGIVAGVCREIGAVGMCWIWRLPTRGHSPLFLKPLDHNSSDSRRRW